MAMSKKGTAIFFLFMIGVTLFIVGFKLGGVLTSSTNLVQSNLNCTSSSLDVSQKVNCGIVDIIAPFITGVILATAGMVIGAKVQFGG